MDVVISIHVKCTCIIIRTYTVSVTIYLFVCFFPTGQERSLPLQSEERDSVIPLVSDEPVAGKKQTSEGGVYEAV